MLGDRAPADRTSPAYLHRQAHLVTAERNARRRRSASATPGTSCRGPAIEGRRVAITYADASSDVGDRRPDRRADHTDGREQEHVRHHVGGERERAEGTDQPDATTLQEDAGKRSLDGQRHHPREQQPERPYGAGEFGTVRHAYEGRSRDPRDHGHGADHEQRESSCRIAETHIVVASSSHLMRKERRREGVGRQPQELGQGDGEGVEAKLMEA